MTNYRAQYNDGRTAASIAAIARVEDTALVIAREDGTVIDRWSWDGVRLSEPATASRPIRLSNRARAGARLSLEDPDILAALRRRAAYLNREPFDRSRAFRLFGIVGACVGAALFFIYGLPWIAIPAASLVPVSWEEGVGESTVALVNQLFADGRDLCSNADGVAALKILTGKLNAAIDTPYAIRADVADSKMVNAFAAPGGRIILFRGLIERAMSPDEVAGVLAHEMAHVRHRHPTQGMINAVGWSSLMSLFTGGAALSNEAVARLAAHLATSAHTRSLESEADASAAAMLRTSGIGSDGMTRFFRSIQSQEGDDSGLLAYLSTHPQTDARIAAIEKNKSAATMPALSDADWQALKGICDKTGG